MLGVIKGIVREKSCENNVYAVTYGMRVNLNHIVTILHKRGYERDLRIALLCKGRAVVSNMQIEQITTPSFYRVKTRLIKIHPASMSEFRIFGTASVR